MAHLRPYMPDRYAATLAADLDVRVYKRAGLNPAIRITADSPAPRKRKVIQVDACRLTHPLFGDRERWFLQLRGMKPGFFSDPVHQAGPQIRRDITTACHDTAQQITKG